MEVTVTVYLVKKDKELGAYFKQIEIPFVPYPGTTLILGVLDSRGTGTTCHLQVEELFWRETNQTEKIAAFGKAEVKDDYLRDCFEKSSEWRRW